MRLKLTDPREELEKLKQWHTWFAWYPVYIPEELQWVWLEKIERKYYYTSREVGLQTFSEHGAMYRTIGEEVLTAYENPTKSKEI
jgi:hypothetical protein